MTSLKPQAYEQTYFVHYPQSKFGELFVGLFVQETALKMTYLNLRNKATKNM